MRTVMDVKMTHAQRWRLRLPPEQMELTTRIIWSLRYALDKKDFTPADVARMTAAQLLNTPNFGRRSLGVVCDWLQRHGFDLAVPEFRKPFNRQYANQCSRYLRQQGYIVVEPYHWPEVKK